MVENILTQSLSEPEAFSAMVASKSSVPEIVKIISGHTSPPLWHIFEHLAFQAFGVSEIVIRSLSLAFYLLTAIFLFKIGSLLFSKKTAALATLLTLLNPFFFSFAFEGGMYSTMAAGVAGSMFFFTKSFFGEGGKWTRVGFIVMTLWALYSHQLSIFAFLIQGLWLIYEISLGRRQTAVRILKSYIAIAILYLPWLYPLYTQTKTFAQGPGLGAPTLFALRDLISEYLAEGKKTWDYKIPYIDVHIYNISLYIVFAVLILKKWWKSIKKTIFMFLWFVGPIGLTWLISQKFQSIFYSSYLLYTIPAAMLILASSRSKFSIIPLTLLIIVFGIIDIQYFTHPLNPPRSAYSETVKSE
jgi:4-amino-4-deoxy-L-arabinose transferase-like glycosyltransferase